MKWHIHKIIWHIFCPRPLGNWNFSSRYFLQWSLQKRDVLKLPCKWSYNDGLSFEDADSQFIFFCHDRTLWPRFTFLYIYKRKYLILLWDFQRVRIHDHHSGDGSRQAGMALKKYQRAYVLICKHKAEGANSKWWAFETLKPDPSYIPLPPRLKPLNLPPILYQQRPKCWNIWVQGNILFQSTTWTHKC